MIIKTLYLIAFLLTAGLFALIPTQADARINFGTSNGYYTNLCGGGSDLNGNINTYGADGRNLCTADCDPNTGVCSARNRFNIAENYANVQKYICNGKVTNCDYSNASPIFVSYSTVHGVNRDTLVNCNQTVQLDVFDQNNDLKGFMTWYSGECAAPVVTPTPTVTPTATPIPTQAPTATPTQVPTQVPTQAPTATPTPTRVPTVAPVPTVPPVIDAEIRCPDGFVQQITGSNIICMQQIQNQNQSVVNTANASTGPITVSLAGIPQGGPIQVVPVEVKQPVVFTQELPKTGLPLVAWAFSGLAPLGLKLKRFGSTKTEGNSILAMWQEREFLKN